MSSPEAHGGHIVLTLMPAFVARAGSLAIHGSGKRITLFSPWIHFGIARAHSHAAPPKSTNTPVDSEKLFVVKRITTYKNRNKGKGNSKQQFLCIAQRFSATQAICL
jgi:hypothetical protein